MKYLVFIFLFALNTLAFSQTCIAPNSANLVQNGDFEASAPPGGDESISAATHWGAIWSGSVSTGDFYNTTTTLPPAILGNIPSPTVQGNFGGFWNRLQGAQAVWREGLMNELASTIQPNTGCYDLTFKVARLFSQTSGTIDMSVYGVNAPGGLGSGSIVNGNTPDNLHIFPAGNTVELANYTFSSGSNNQFQTLTFQFNSNMLPPSGITHIFFTRNDGVAGAEYLALDDVCLIPGNCPLLCPTCPNSLLSNGGFNNGTSIGSMPSPGATNDWQDNTGSPQLSPDSCTDAYSMQMWGNRDVGESVIQQNVNFEAGKTYKITFRARFRPASHLPTPYVRLGFTATNSSLNPFTDANKHNIGSTANGEISADQWGCYTLNDWTPSQDYDHLIINAFNDVPDVTGNANTVSWARIDNVCIEEVIVCPSCPSTLLSNNGFNNGTTIGSMPSQGATNDWQVNTGSPQLSPDSCKDAYSMQMWGNRDVGESVIQNNVNFEAGKTYKITFCARFRPASHLPTPYVRLGFTASNSSLNPFTDGNKHNIGSTANGEISVDQWGCFTLNDWTPSQDYDHLIINAFNDVPDVTGNANTVSWARIDNVCIEEVQTTVVFTAAPVKELNVFPNPTSGSLQVSLEKSIQTDINIQVYDTQGRVLVQQVVQQGETNFSLDVEFLTPSMYILRATDENGNIWMSRFIKQ